MRSISTSRRDSVGRRSVNTFVCMLCIVLLMAGCGRKKAPAGTASNQENAAKRRDAALIEVKAVLSAAAGMPNAEFNAIAMSASSPQIDFSKSTPLTMLMLCFRPDAVDGDLETLNREIGVFDKLPKPSEMAETISKSAALGYGSIIQPDMIDECTGELEGDELRGSVRFRFTRTNSATARFTAKEVDEKWVVQQFEFPAWGLRTTLENGIWKASGESLHPHPLTQLPFVAELGPRDTSRERVVVAVGFATKGANRPDKTRAVAYRGGEQLPLDTIAGYLTSKVKDLEARGKSPATDALLVVQADKDFPAQAIEALALAASQAGFRSVAFAARSRDDKDETEGKADRNKFGPAGLGEVRIELPPPPPLEKLHTQVVPTDTEIPIPVELRRNNGKTDVILGHQHLGADQQALSQLSGRLRQILAGAEGMELEIVCFEEVTYSDQLNALNACISGTGKDRKPLAPHIALGRAFRQFVEEELRVEDVPLTVDQAISPEVVGPEVMIEEVNPGVDPGIGGQSGLDLPDGGIGGKMLDDTGLTGRGSGTIGRSGERISHDGTSMDRITLEIILLQRTSKVAVVWLIDESASLQSQRKQWFDRLKRTMHDIGVLDGKGDTVFAVASFGEKEVHFQTAQKKLTTDAREVVSAMERIPIDPSGNEKPFLAVQQVIQELGSAASAERRKLAIYILTDEAGDDVENLEPAIRKARLSKAVINVVGRESTFGSANPRMRWKDPNSKLDHLLKIHRGTESGDLEVLQFDGMHERFEAYPSGFGPYHLTRLCKETGGDFLFTSDEETALDGQPEADKRKFERDVLSQYSPELNPREEYKERRGKSKFREAVFLVVSRLNPATDAKLTIQQLYYPADKEKFVSAGKENFDRALRNMELLDAAITQLEAVKPLRDGEESKRWRANYDLALAQCKAYRVRLFEFCLTMDKQLNEFPAVANAEHIVWSLVQTTAVIQPDERQIKLTKVDAAKIGAQAREANDELQFVSFEHPGTPWANMAEFELKRGFGWTWKSEFRDPRYDEVTQEELPKL